MRAAIRQAIQGHVAELQGLARKIHQNPELGYEEEKACGWQTELLRRWGFEVTTPFAGLPTAYRAVAGQGGPVFCFMAEYDALPEIGHACGHNLICAVALGAGQALAQVLKQNKMPGTVVVMGAPAEESQGGKVKMLAEGALEGIDAVMMAHPSFRTVPDPGSTAIERFRVSFQGKAAHAAAAPELGQNALDAVMLLFQGVNAWRQQLAETSRIHGVVEEGGVVPNIIPEKASCRFFLRSPDNQVLAGMVERFSDIVKGAGLMTATRPAIASLNVPYKARKPNAPPQ